MGPLGALPVQGGLLVAFAAGLAPALKHRSESQSKRLAKILGIMQLVQNRGEAW